MASGPGVACWLLIYPSLSQLRQAFVGYLQFVFRFLLSRSQLLSFQCLIPAGLEHWTGERILLVWVQEGVQREGVQCTHKLLFWKICLRRYQHQNYLSSAAEGHFHSSSAKGVIPGEGGPLKACKRFTTLNNIRPGLDW